MFFLGNSVSSIYIRCIAFFAATLFLTNSAIAGGSATPSSAATFASSSTVLWTSLNPVQKTILAPLATEWNRLNETQQKKWLEIAAKYPSMKADEQLRLQERMKSWVKLTPEQRSTARENFALTTKLKPEVKSAKWQEYQQLSEQDKQRLAEEAARKKNRVTNIPTADQRQATPLQPLKTAPKTSAKSTPAVVGSTSSPRLPAVLPTTTTQPSN